MCVCVPYNIPDRINQTNVYTNLYVKATQHFELNFIVLYIYIHFSQLCVCFKCLKATSFCQRPYGHFIFSKAT